MLHVRVEEWHAAHGTQVEPRMHASIIYFQCGKGRVDGVGSGAQGNYTIDLNSDDFLHGRLQLALTQRFACLRWE